MANDLRALIGTKSHVAFENKLRELIKDKTARETFYDQLIRINLDLTVDSFRSYFEEYSAERKSNMQDYTPDEVAHILAVLSGETELESPQVVYDGAAGTGSLLIAKWAQNPNIEVIATEYADNAIAYLIHNLAMRGMVGEVRHGNTITEDFQAVYKLTKSEGLYSNIEVTHEA